MSEIIHKRQDEEGGFPFGDEDTFLRGITLSFSWDYPDDFSLKDVQENVFFVYDEKNKPRSESQYTCDCIQESGAGVLLLKPHPEINSPSPSEIHFTPNHPSQCEFLIQKMTIVSESRHLELYIDNVYEMTAKGCALTLKKGSKPALYECQFEIPNHFEPSQKLGLKFLSLGDRNTMRLQAVIIQVTHHQKPAMQNQTPFPQGVTGLPGTSNVDIGGVREMLQSMGLNVPNKADQLMTDIEHQQKQLQMKQLQGLANVGLMAQLQTLTHQQQTLQQQNQSMQFLQAMFNPTKPNTNSPTTNGHAKSSSSSTRGSSRSASPRLTNGHRSPESKYPVSRESVNPPESSLRRASSTSTIKSQSVGSFDHYNGFGTSYPSTDSILQSAIHNEEEARQLARTRASHIEEQNQENNNYEKTQIEMVKNFLRSSDPTSRKITITKLPPKPARGRPQKRGDGDRKPRPHSMSALPSASEVDFTKLLSQMMHEEKEGLASGDEKATFGPDANNARWSAYLRSRVRASQRFSSSASSNYPSSDTLDDVISPSESCPSCGCQGCNATLNKMHKEMLVMEARMTHQMQTQISNLQQHIDSRIDQMYSMMMGNFFNMEPSTSAV